MVNFGTATTVLNSQTITFNFDEALLAPDVNIAMIRGSCMDGSQDLLLGYPPMNPYNINLTCNNGVYIFETLNRESGRIGFPFSIEVSSPTLGGKYALIIFNPSIE